jgi:hypothetical protein
MADVAVTLDGTVSGLRERMQIAPELGAYLMSDPDPLASFVADLDGRNVVVHSMHVISLSSAVQACL